MMDAIKMHEVTQKFGAVTAVEQLTLAVQEGEIFGLLGPDGAGKTTIMRLLAGLLTPSAGEAWVCGFHTLSDVEALRNHISYMPQRFGLYLDLTVQENIDFYADLYNVPKTIRKEKIPELLAFSNMTAFRDRQARNLSGGMKQKLALACALVHTPKVLLLDEPTNGVDPMSRRDFWRILGKLLEEKVTIFVSTSYLDEAERCDRVGLLYKGRLILAGKPAEIKAKMNGVLLEIRCSAPRTVLPLLKAAMQPRSAGLFGNKIHLVALGEAAQVEADLKEKLRELDIQGEVAVITPSLEDVFISMLTTGESGD